MTHIAIAEKLNGSPVDWRQQVTAEPYRIGRTINDQGVKS